MTDMHLPSTPGMSIYPWGVASCISACSIVLFLMLPILLNMQYHSSRENLRLEMNVCIIAMVVDARRGACVKNSPHQ
jgi:hypothetical protein